MPDNQPELPYEDSTLRIHAIVSQSDDGKAVIRLSPLDAAEGSKEWPQTSLEQEAQLTRTLVHEFAVIKATSEKAPGKDTEVSQIVIPPNPGTSTDDHIRRVLEIVSRFIEENQIELDTGDHKFGDMVKKPASVGHLGIDIQRIIQAHGIDSDKSAAIADDIVELVAERRDKGTGRN